MTELKSNERKVEKLRKDMILIMNNLKIAALESNQDCDKDEAKLLCAQTDFDSSDDEERATRRQRSQRTWTTWIWKALWSPTKYPKATSIF